MKVKDIIKKLKTCDKEQEIFIKLGEDKFLLDIGLGDSFVYAYPYRLEIDHSRRVNIIREIKGRFLKDENA